MKKGKIRVATCQFPVSGRIGQNSQRILEQMAVAKRRKADVVHFPEAALSGYAGHDVKTWEGFDWQHLRAETEKIMAAARKRKIWVIFGSAHPLSRGHQPHNSLYAVTPSGRIVDRYDKRFCTGADLELYSPGDHFSIFDINGVRCGMAICYDVRFPELHREYRKLDAQLMFHSFYNARAEGPGIHRIIMPPTLQARAASNYFFISASNSSAYYSWPSIFVQPDGVIAGRLTANRPGVMVNVVDATKDYYDASRHHRELAMRGVLSSGNTVSDPRSQDRQSL